MNYNINLKNLKQSALNLSNFLKSKDIELSHSANLEAISKILFLKNWQTAQAVATNPQTIEHISVCRYYIFEFTVNAPENIIKQYLKESFLEAKCVSQAINFLQKNNDYHIQIDMSKSDSNILTAIFLLCDKLKNSSYNVSRFDYCRVVQEKENMMEFFES